MRGFGRKLLYNVHTFSGVCSFDANIGDETLEANAFTIGNSGEIPRVIAPEEFKANVDKFHGLVHDSSGDVDVHIQFVLGRAE